MRHILNIIGLTGLALVLSILQFILTGIYGKIMFIPILSFLLFGYLLKYSLNSSKVLKK